MVMNRSLSRRRSVLDSITLLTVHQPDVICLLETGSHDVETPEGMKREAELKIEGGETDENGMKLRTDREYTQEHFYQVTERL